MAPGVVDARRCLAWLVQAEGVFPVEHRVALGDRLYGCDECQEVCPPSSRAEASADADGGSPEDRGFGDRDPGDWVDVLDVLAAADAELLARYGRWYIPRREPRYLRRNALIVLGNSGRADDPERGAPALTRALADADPIVRGHAVWAARRLGVDDLLDAVRHDDDPLVRAELDRDDVGAVRVERIGAVRVAEPRTARRPDHP